MSTIIYVNGLAVQVDEHFTDAKARYEKALKTGQTFIEYGKPRPTALVVKSIDCIAHKSDG